MTRRTNKFGFRRAASILFMLIGTVLLIAALALFAYNKWDADRAERASADVMDELEEVLPDTLTDSPLYPEPERQMTTVNIDGYDYIGYLSVPSLNLTLPVMAEWSYAGLKIAPGRFSGNIYTDDLVICGHNYARHFSPLKWIKEGTAIDFTDMENEVWHFEVSAVETLKPTQVKEMSGKADGDEWDLTLFTCNTGGQTRCAVRCVRVK